MLVIVIAHLCLSGHYPGKCKNVMVTDQATFGQCTGSFALQVLPAWLTENGYTQRGWKLARWGCVVGGKRTDA